MSKSDYKRVTTMHNGRIADWLRERANELPVNTDPVLLGVVRELCVLWAGQIEHMSWDVNGDE